jgi:phage recombination protein Bet
MNEVTVVPHRKVFNAEEIKLIKDTICKGASDNELKLFLGQCERTGLDPFSRQIYSIERSEQRNGQWVKARTIQTSIDGFRLIAERSKHYAGQLGPFWCGSDGVWHDVWLVSTPPVAARVGVLRNDFKEPCWGVARFDAYAGKTRDGSLTKMWKEKGDVMIAKCAESLALRKAFPQELSGLYTGDEMKDEVETVTAEVVTTPSMIAAEAPEKGGNVIEPEPQGDIVDPETGEVNKPHTIVAQSAMTWANLFTRAVNMAASDPEIDQWLVDNEYGLEQLKKYSEKAHQNALSSVANRRKELKKKTAA